MDQPLLVPRAGLLPDERCWPIYPEIAHIPFLVAAPGLEGGRTIDALLQPPDILPTLLDLAGLQVAPAEPLHGRSFAPLLRGEPQPPLHDCAISASFLRIEARAKATKWITPALYTERWAYVPIGAQGERELFDMAKDPYAGTNVAADHPQVVHDLHARLRDWLREIGAPPEAAVFLDWKPS